MQPPPRRLQPELMDDPALDATAHRHALAGLARINTFSRAGATLWSHTARLLGDRRAASVLDVAVGSGDVLVDLFQRAGRDGVVLSPQAVDVSPEALAATTERARSAGLDVVTHRRDVVRDGLDLPDASIDAVLCSLFLHHLGSREVVAILREMARVARVGVVVSDLVRSRRAVVAANIAGRVFTRSPIVRVDAVRSVQGAFTIGEMRTMASEAGLPNAIVTSTWPLRMTLVWRRP